MNRRKSEGLAASGKILIGLLFCGALFFISQIDGRPDRISDAAVPKPEPAKAPVREVDKFYATALDAVAAGEWLRARDALDEIQKEDPDFATIPQARELWGEAVWAMMNTNLSSPESVVYTVASGDTLGKIARAHGTTVELIRRRNNLAGDKIRVGQKLSVFSKPLSLLVDKTSNHLFVQMDGQTIKVYPVSTGKSDTTTPEGDFVIRDRLPHPTWFHNGKVVPPESPENELGTRWLGFDKPKYGIHGTIHPEHIGQSVSSGCVRMRNEDVEELFDRIPVGTRVLISGGSVLK